jgi:hypothetical protein
MAAPFDQMTQTNTPGGSNAARPKYSERRASRRCKITQLMRIRPSDPERKPFEDIRSSLSLSRTGVYFQSSETEYQVGMRLFVTMPYTKEPTALSHEYLAEVVRRDHLPNGLFGIGFKILLQMGLQSTFRDASWMSRK